MERKCNLGVFESVTLPAGFCISGQVTAAPSDQIQHLTGTNEKVSCGGSSSFVFVIWF